MALLWRRGTRDSTRSEHLGSPGDARDLACVDIADAPARRRIRIEGQIVRMRARPASGIPALSVTISDATGSITVVWTGRRAIGGLTLGRHVIIEGVGCRVGDRLEFTNPSYTLLPG